MPISAITGASSATTLRKNSSNRSPDDVSSGQVFYAGTPDEGELENTISYMKQQKEIFVDIRHEYVKTCIGCSLGLSSKSDCDEERKLYEKFKKQLQELKTQKRELRSNLEYSKLRSVAEDVKNGIEDFFLFKII